jgi:predicted DCC family thiol-disulfide oxidoreductase YuxK
VTAITSTQPVLFFDGECNLCNGAVQFVIRNDKKNLFLFAPLQSEPGKEAMAQTHQPTGMPANSIVLKYNGRFFTQSDAALQTLKLLGGFWSIFHVAKILPRFIRDGIYNIISRNRYAWFGKRNECMIPTPELKKRFL